MKRPTEKELYEYVKGHYYSDMVENGDDENYPWEPFEDYSKEQIEEFIQNEINSIKKLIDW